MRWSFVLCAAVLLVPTGDADACEPMPCHSGSLLPSGGTIPANTEALRWDVGQPMALREAKSKVTLQQDGKDVAFAVEADGETVVRIVPKQPWVQGANYTLSATNACPYDGPKELSASFTVGPEAAMPTSLGSVVLHEPGKGTLTIGTSAGSCSEDEEAVWADVGVALSDDAKPWAALLDFTFAVDGERWVYEPSISATIPRGGSAVGRGKERIYQSCAAESMAFKGAGPGSHAVSLTARVLGSTTELTASSLELSVDCDDGVTAPGAPASVATPIPSEPSPAPAAPTAHGKAGGCSVGGSGSPWLLWIALLGFRRRHSGMH